MYKVFSLMVLLVFLSGCVGTIIKLATQKPEKELTPEEIALEKKQLDDALDYFSKPMKVREFFAFLDVEKLVVYKKDQQVKLDLHKYKKDKPVITINARLDCSGNTMRSGFHSTYLSCSFKQYNEKKRRYRYVGSFSVSVVDRDHKVVSKQKTWFSEEETIDVKKGDMLVRYSASGKPKIFIVDFDESPLVSK